MTPHLTPSGRTLLLATSSLILIGTVTTNWPILLMGECLAVLLTVAYFLRIPVLLAVEEGFVRVGIATGDESPTITGVTGRDVDVEIEIVNLSRLTLNNLTLRAAPSVGLRFDPRVIRLSSVGSQQRVRLLIQARSTQGASRTMLHGFHLKATSSSGLAEVSDYLPTPQAFKFYPAASFARNELPTFARQTSKVQRMGSHPVQRRGFGSDFRELRDHVMGDPFRSIAWKATARTGKLMVREFEEEVIANVFILLDISSTMRGGDATNTKLQHTIELISQLAGVLARGQDRVGLVSFDEVVYGHIKTSSARVSLSHIINHLVGLSSVVDADFTEYDDDEAVSEIVRYLMVQERLDFRWRRPKKHGVPTPEYDQFDTDLLDQWLKRTLVREERRLSDSCLQAAVVARKGLSLVRQYCQLRGVALPFRLEARFGAKEMGMVNAIRRFLDENRESHLLIIFSDLCGLIDTREIVKALKLVLGRKHKVVFIMPYTPDYLRATKRTDSGGTAGYHREDALVEVFRLAERRERARIARTIGNLGIPVVTAGPSDSIDMLLSRVRLRH